MKIFAQGGRADLVRVALVAVSGILLTPYSFDSYYIPLIMKSARPELFPGDLFVGASAVYNSFYFSLAGLASRFADLQSLSLVFYLGVVVATALAVFRLGMALSGSRRAAYVAVFLLLIPKLAFSVAYAGINRGRLEPSALAGAVLLWALLFFLEGRRRTACLMTSCMFYVQGMEATVVAAMFLWHLAAARKEVPAREALICAALLGVPAIPMALKVIGSGLISAGPGGESAALWLDILRSRSWYHLFPSSWGPGDWFNYSGWFIWSGLVFRFGPPLVPAVRSFFWAIGFICAIGIFFSEVIPVPFVIKMVPLRSSVYFLVLLLVYTAAYLSGWERKGAVWRALAAAGASAILLAQYKLIVCLGLLLLALELGRGSLCSRLSAYAGSAGLVAFTVGTVFSGKLPETRGFLFLDIGIAAMGFFVAAASCSYLSAFSARLRAPAAVFMLLLGTAACVHGWTPYGYRPDPGTKKDWSRLQVWVSVNTARDSVFITPPHLEGFRIYSLRTVVVELKDGAAALYEEVFAIAWWRRLNDFGYTELAVNPAMSREIERLYAGMDADSLLSLAAKYGADYIVREGGCPAKLATVHRVGRFSVCGAGRVNRAKRGAS